MRTAVVVNTAAQADIEALVASVAGLFVEDAGQHDSLTDIHWPARGGTAYYSGLVADHACLLCWPAPTTRSSGIWSAR